MARPIRAVAYVRLSREDRRGKQATDEKLEDRAQMCRDLAHRHGLPLAEEDIKVELSSGTSLARRPELVRILEMARARQITHVITPYQDRLTRGGDQDRGEIKDAFLRGCITLVSLSEGVIAFDADFGTHHELTWDVKGAAAAYMVRDTIDKRKQADRVRLKQGKRNHGAAAYGYRWLRPVCDEYGVLRSPGRYEAHPDEYPIVEEIFRRLLAPVGAEKAPEIARDLQRRGVRPPGATRPGTGNARRWHASSVYGMMRNPFYCGFMSQRWIVERGRTKTNREIKKRLRPDEYVLSDVKGDWPCPINAEQHYAMQNRIEGHTGRAASRTGLLTGIVFCPNGRPMVRRTHESYGCDCKQTGDDHAGGLCSGERLLRWAREIVDAVVDCLPDDALPTPKRGGRGDVQARITRLRREQQEKQQTVEDLMQRGSYYETLFGPENYAATAQRARTALESVRRHLAELEAVAATPDTDEAVTLLRRIRRVGGMTRFWETATHEEQRAVIERVVKRVDMVRPEVRYYRQAHVTLWEWAAEYAPVLPPFPKIAQPGNVKNLLRGRTKRQ